MHTYITSGRFQDREKQLQIIETTKRNFFLFSLMKTLPLCGQNIIYDDGSYNYAGARTTGLNWQKVTSITEAEGKYDVFENYFNILNNFPEMTEISDDVSNTFLSLSNNSTHEPTLLQAPEYAPTDFVDNTEYDAEHADRFTVDGKTIHVDNLTQMTHYHVNASMYSVLGKWFDYLRENGVYDNTRIIIVSDHGQGLACLEGEIQKIEPFYPLLLMKDFDSTGFTISDEFMTNADVPTLATQNLIENATNPFTGKKIDNAEKTAHDQLITMSTDWIIYENNGNTFLPSTWASVHDNIWDLSNWSFCDEELVLKEHALP